MRKKIVTKQVIPNAGFTVKGSIRSAVFELDRWFRRKLTGGCYEYQARFNGADLFVLFTYGATQVHLFRKGSKVIACNGFLHIPPSEILDVGKKSKSKHKQK